MLAATTLAAAIARSVSAAARSLAMSISSDMI
jgi:hypothetical protein